jgi:hypothetical protein
MVLELEWVAKQSLKVDPRAIHPDGTVFLISRKESLVEDLLVMDNDPVRGTMMIIMV